MLQRLIRHHTQVIEPRSMLYVVERRPRNQRPLVLSAPIAVRNGVQRNALLAFASPDVGRQVADERLKARVSDRVVLQCLSTQELLELSEKLRMPSVVVLNCYCNSMAEGGAVQYEVAVYTPSGLTTVDS